MNTEQYITDMSNIFAECTNAFNYPVQIPNSVRDMSNAFYNCRRFNQPITIPNSVINMSKAFANSVLNQPLTIPDSVQSLSFAFENCKFNG